MQHILLTIANWLFQALVGGGLVLMVSALARADDWMSWPSSYTHEPTYGQRVDQYAAASEPLAPHRQDFVRSGYRHFRSTLQTGQSADNLHVVEQWGRPVIPYESWRFPYRPYAVPYDAWGPQAPYGIYNGNFGFGAGMPYPAHPTPPPNGMFQRPAVGGGLHPHVSPSPGFPLTPPYNSEPWFDGTYPTAPPLN